MEDDKQVAPTPRPVKASKVSNIVDGKVDVQFQLSLPYYEQPVIIKKEHVRTVIDHLTLLMEESNEKK